jgi:hypothetical protein
LSKLEDWFSIFESPEEIKEIEVWEEKKNKLLEAIDFFSEISEIEGKIKYFKNSLVSTDNLVRSIILDEKKSIVLSRLSTLNCEHYFCLMRSKVYHIDILTFFQHQAHTNQIFLITHEDKSLIPMKERKATKYYNPTNSISIPTSAVNRIMVTNYKQKLEQKNTTTPNNDEIEAKNWLLMIKRNNKKQTVRESTTKLQFDSPVKLEEAKWMDWIDILLQLQTGSKENLICLLKGCNSKKFFKNNTNFIRHLTRQHSLGADAHFVGMVKNYKINFYF